MISTTQIIGLIFIALRLAGLFGAMPFFSIANVSPLLRYMLVLSMALVLAPTIPVQVLPSVLDRTDLVLLVVLHELGLGLFMGFTVRMLFIVVSMGMEIAGMQMGFSMASLFDPQNNSQVTVVGQLTSVMAVLFFFATNMHHDVISTLVRSYQIFPVGLPTFDYGNMALNLAKFLGHAFDIALRIAMPVLSSLLVIHFIMAMISKTAPQMNLFFNLAITLNIVVGLLLIVVTFPRMFPFIRSFEGEIIKSGLGMF